MNIEIILKKIHKGTPLTEEEYEYLYEECFEDEDVYEIQRKGDILYQVIFHLGNEYYSAYRIVNDMWGSEWMISTGITRVYPRERTTIDWVSEEEK